LRFRNKHVCLAPADNAVDQLSLPVEDSECRIGPDSVVRSKALGFLVPRLNIFAVFLRLIHLYFQLYKMCFEEIAHLFLREYRGGHVLAGTTPGSKAIDKDMLVFGFCFSLHFFPCGLVFELYSFFLRYSQERDTT